MDKTKIEWTDATWNPVTGCSKVSQGCKHCYAEVMAERLQAMGSPKYQNGFRVTLHDQEIGRRAQPVRWKRPRRIFVNSMSDLFHEEVPEGFIESVFGVMLNCPQHTFQVLTKRHERVFLMAHRLPWPQNVWMGVSVENADALHRVRLLQLVPAAVRFLSCEPLIGPLHGLNLAGIHWVIVGGESGPNAREMKPEWVRDIRKSCLEQNVPFFFKQWGGRNKKAAGRELDGKLYSEFPTEAT